jgi:hypothetical protein
MTREDTSKLADGPGQAIRRLPTGCYELSANLQRPQPSRQSGLPRPGGLYRGSALFDEKKAAGWKVEGSVLVVSVVVLLGFGGVATLTTKMLGTVPELPTETQTAAPVSPAAAHRPESNHASMEALARGGVGDSTAPTEVAKSTSTSPREWLIENLAAAARDPRLRKQAPTSPGSTAVAAAARSEVPVGSRSPDDAERRPEEALGSAGKSPRLGIGDPQMSELQSPPISRTRMDKRRSYVHHTARRDTIKSVRRKTGYGLFWNGGFRPWPFW